MAWRLATACSGCDVCVLAAEMIVDELKSLLGVDVDFRHVWSCESEPFKQQLLAKVVGIEKLFPDVTRLGTARAFNELTQSEEAIPPFDILIVGWSCKDFSQLKDKKLLEPSKTGECLLAEGRGTSGRTFHGVLAATSEHRPKVVLMENVTGC